MNGSIAYILDQLNSFHKRMQFTYKVEHNNKLPYLDVLLIKNASKIDITVYLAALTQSTQVKDISMKK